MAPFHSLKRTIYEEGSTLSGIGMLAWLLGSYLRSFMGCAFLGIASLVLFLLCDFLRLLFVLKSFQLL